MMTTLHSDTLTINVIHKTLYSEIAIIVPEIEKIKFFKKLLF